MQAPKAAASRTMTTVAWAPQIGLGLRGLQRDDDPPVQCLVLGSVVGRDRVVGAVPDHGDACGSDALTDHPGRHGLRTRFAQLLVERRVAIAVGEPLDQ